MNSKISFFSAALAASAGLLSATVGHAGPAWEFSSPGNGFTNGNWDFAQAFTANSAVTVSGLGYYADPVTGNVDSNPVALYACDNADCSGGGTLIASAVVTNTYAIQGHFRYVTIAPVTLVAGQSYEVAGQSSADNYTWADPGFATDPALSLISLDGGTDRWLINGGTTFLNGSNNQTNLGGEDGYWGPDLFLGTATFAGTPEPGTWALMLVGFGAAGAMLRGSRRKAIA